MNAMQRLGNQEIIKCWATNSTQYALNQHQEPIGIMIHSSGTRTPALKTHIQPSKSDLNYDFLIQKIGRSSFIGNSLNHSHRSVNYHYFIGKLDNNELGIVQAHPEDMKVWPDEYIHIFICEDHNQEYANNVMSKLTALCEDICDEYGWDYSRVIDCSEKYPYRVDASV